MGEYAKYKGQKIKIGTCEDMYYLRADQAPFVEVLPGNVDPIADAEYIRYRFPWPDEDDIEPGQFEDYNRGLTIWGMEVPTEVNHYSVQFKADNGYLVSLPCPEGSESDIYKIHKNGYGGAVKLVQQRVWEGKLVTICRCGGCGAAYRLPTLNDVLPMISSLEFEARKQESTFYTEVAKRVLAGYSMNIEQGVALIKDAGVDL